MSKAINLELISKTISHALRHEPWLYNLELDEQGFVGIDSLISEISKSLGKNISINTIQDILNTSTKKRFEIENGKIRAYYGHSIPQKVLYIPAVPPEILYHGTTSEVYKTIMSEGLKSMTRQYVHLSTDIQTASLVASRKTGSAVILKIKALEAQKSGHLFYHPSDIVWLSDFIPAEFIEV